MKTFVSLSAWSMGCFCHLALAAPDISTADHTAPERPALRASAQHSQEIWGLTEQEWAKFESLQTGPRRYWSPQLDPLTTLGVEAETDQERQRYAELQVRLEAKRAERELAYQKAYTQAWAKLYPDLMPIQGMATTANTASQTATRSALFVKDDCDSCMNVAKRLQDQGTAFDLYLVGSDGDDDSVRRWAKAAGIVPANVQRRQITLNHDRGRWFSLGAFGSLPARFEQVNGQWQRIE